MKPCSKLEWPMSTPPKAIPSPKEVLKAIEGVVKGKILARMKKEAVDCPVS
jgi:hypothetical protein